MSTSHDPAVWFPTVRTGTGTDAFTENLSDGLRKFRVRTEISWLPLRAEYAPWSVTVPQLPPWADIVHVNTWLHPRFLPKHLPVVATVHHSVHHPDFESYKGWARSAYHRYWIRPIERIAMRRADRVVAVSQFAADSARETLLDRPVQVITNGVNVELFRPPAQKSQHRPFRLLYVGSWIIRKGVDLLAPIMRELGDGYELRYTGPPSVGKDSRMPTNMHNLGRLNGANAVVAAMQEVDALLLPSRSEGFPLVIVEAMACGLPVIATRGSSLAEVVENGVSGILCPRDDVVAFVQAVKRLAGDDGRWSNMGRAARLRAERYFRLEAMVERYLEIYRAVLATTARSGSHDRS